MASRTRVRRRRLLALLMAVGALGVLSGPVAGAVGVRTPEAPARTYVVRPGDTLWRIAVRFEPDQDPRPLVEAISAANRVDAGALVPGQRLTIPAAD